MLDGTDDDAVQILLNRMDSHPEEFYSTHLFSRNLTLPVDGRWDWLFAYVLTRKNKMPDEPEAAKLVLPFLSDAEVNILYDRFVRINRKLFKTVVMDALLNGDNSRYSGQERYRIGSTGLAVVTRSDDSAQIKV